MDMQMPVVDGLEAARRIRKTPGATARVPIIAMTANATAADREACIAAAMDDHITKPIRIPDLIERLRRHVRPGSRPLNEQLATLRAEISDDAVFRKVVEEFHEHIEHLTERLGSDAPMGTDEVATAAHDLKGCAATLGMDDLASHARALECAAKAGSLETGALRRRITGSWRKLSPRRPE